MRRRTLIVRRFDELSFGLGYIEDGIWIDHATALASGEDLLAGPSDANQVALDAFHTWFDCCGAAAVAKVAITVDEPLASSVRS